MSVKQLEQLILNLQRIDFQDWLIEFFDLPIVEVKVLELNKEQLYIGIRSDGSDITPYYRPLTEFYKVLKGQPIDRVTLKDTGDFYNSFKLSVNRDSIEIYATDIKTIELQAKYGENILGLTQESINNIKTLLLDFLKNKLRNSLKT